MTIRYVLTPMILLVFPLVAFAGPTSLDELCKSVACRGETKVSLSLDAGKTWQGTFPASPFVIDGETVNLVPGETIYLAGAEKDGALTGLTAFRSKPADETAIEISFKQETETGKPKSMVLSIINPYDQPLKYSAGIMPLGEKTLYKTSTCPILPGLSSHETWPDPILRLVLSDFRLIDERKETLECN